MRIENKTLGTKMQNINSIEKNIIKVLRINAIKNKERINKNLMLKNSINNLSLFFNAVTIEYFYNIFRLNDKTLILNDLKVLLYNLKNNDNIKRIDDTYYFLNRLKPIPISNKSIVLICSANKKQQQKEVKKPYSYYVRIEEDNKRFLHNAIRQKFVF